MAAFLLRARSSLSTDEILRKGIHISGFAVPFVCVYLFNNLFVILSLLLAAILYAVSEFARSKGVNVPVLSNITRRASTSSYGINRFDTAPISFALGITLTLLIFPTSIAYAAIAVLTLGDSFAAIFGKVLGKTPLIFTRKKRLEGTICGFTPAFLGSTIFISPVNALFAAAVGMLVEGLPTHIDDNLVIPLSVGTVLTLITLLL